MYEAIKSATGASTQTHGILEMSNNWYITKAFWLVELSV